MGAVFCIVGKSNSGKTTLIERLIPEIRARGLTVAAVKHDAHGDAEIDQPGKDSHRLRKAGADTVVLSSPRQVVFQRNVVEDTPLQTLTAALALEHDVVLAEGYRADHRYPKVEVHRASFGPELLTTPKDRIAVVSDGALAVECPLFKPDDASGLAALLVQRVQEARAAADMEVSLLVDGDLVSLNPFAQSVLARGVWGILSAFREAESGKAAVVRLRRRFGP